MKTELLCKAENATEGKHEIYITQAVRSLVQHIVDNGLFAVRDSVNHNEFNEVLGSLSKSDGVVKIYRVHITTTGGGQEPKSIHNLIHLYCSNKEYQELYAQDIALEFRHRLAKEKEVKELKETIFQAIKEGEYNVQPREV